MPSFVAMGIVVVRYNSFSFSYDLAKPRDSKIMLLYGWETITVSHTLAKFGGYNGEFLRNL